VAGAPDEDVVGREQTFGQRINVLVITVQEQTVYKIKVIFGVFRFVPS
jgi:hypothetical protein